MAGISPAIPHLTNLAVQTLQALRGFAGLHSSTLPPAPPPPSTICPAICGKSRTGDVPAFRPGQVGHEGGAPRSFVVCSLVNTGEIYIFNLLLTH